MVNILYSLSQINELAFQKKYENTVERERLETLLKKYTREEYGIIVRTNAAGVSEETLTKELELLQLRYEELMRKAKIAAGKTLLYREPPHYITLGKELPAKHWMKFLQIMQKFYRTEGIL